VPTNREFRFRPNMWSLLVCWFGLFRVVSGQESGVLSDDIASKLDHFEAKIRPVLIKYCYECHSSSERKYEGSLRLDSKQGWAMGGDSGAAIVAGDPASSLLWKALRYDGLQMPPTGRLDANIIRDFEEWIRDGAHDPRNVDGIAKNAIDLSTADSHWAFQPILATEPISRIGNNPIDSFIQDKLSERRWTPSESVDDSTWLRRVYLDLIGIPPTEAEQLAFAQMDSLLAKQSTVEQLLASPQYGVRWSRHWLDLVRYADTNGADENHDMPNAWRYRDWVVKALNEDKPFDRFVMEQIAGDLLPPPLDESEAGDLITATGFLVIGPKMLAEQDKAKMRIDIVDEQIDTLSKTLLGTTIACARCHDHKFDPITQEDYFALAGILMSTRTMADEAFVSKWMERPLPSAATAELRRQFQPKIDAARQSWEQVQKEANDALLATGKFESLPKKPEEHYTEDFKARFNTSKKELDELELEIPKFEMAMSVEEGTPTRLPTHIRGNHLNHGAKLLDRSVPRVLLQKCDLAEINEDVSGRLELAKWIVSPAQPLFARVMVNRVWMWHFGQPLVASPANFGIKGDKPTHPEMLDWLASSWMAQGWSLKRLHRDIVLSQAYARDSKDRRFQSTDPENKLLWRAHRHRIEIEPLRDSILHVAGKLDLRLNGPPGKPTDARRTLYSRVNRAALEDMFATFDYVEPANHIEQRPTTTVPFQSLFLMNHPLIFECGDSIADELILEGDLSARIRKAYAKLFSRSPTERELISCIQFVTRAENIVTKSESKAGDQEKKAWAALVRCMLASTEFSWGR
jgi:hypothetical protein